MAAGEYDLAEAGEPMGDGSLGLFLRGCFAATDEDRSTGRALVLFGLVGSIAACLRLLEMEIGTKVIGSPFGESEEAGVDLTVLLRPGAALVGGRIVRKRASARSTPDSLSMSLFCVTCFRTQSIVRLPKRRWTD